MDKAALERTVQDTAARLGELTFYELLGVPPDANEKQIREAFHEKARVFHVDRYSEDLGHLREPMLRIFGEMSRAHSSLTDREARAEYDASLELAEKGVPTDVRTIFMADQAFRNGRRLVERNSFRAAAAELATACELNPTEPDYWAYRYWAEYGLIPMDAEGRPTSMKQVREIRDALTELVGAHERCVAARVFLGHIHRVEGDIDEATKRYKQALRLDPDNRDAHSSLRIMNRRQTKKPSFLERLFGKK